MCNAGAAAAKKRPRRVPIDANTRSSSKPQSVENVGKDAEWTRVDARPARSYRVPGSTIQERLCNRSQPSQMLEGQHLVMFPANDG